MTNCQEKTIFLASEPVFYNQAGHAKAPPWLPQLIVIIAAMEARRNRQQFRFRCPLSRHRSKAPRLQQFRHLHRNVPRLAESPGSADSRSNRAVDREFPPVAVPALTPRLRPQSSRPV